MAFVGLSGGHAAMVRPKYLVGWDDRSGAAEVARHLLELGHRRLAVLAGVSSDTADKIAGFVETPRDAGCEPFLTHCGSEADPYAAGQTMLRDLLDQHPETTAVFCRNDLLAIGALSMAAQLGIRVPEHLSIAGYSNVPMSAYTIPPLTTVATPIREAGRNALEILLAGLEGREPEQTELQLPVTLVCRQSTGPVRS
jgi:LacI family transcriptional regulator